MRKMGGGLFSVAHRPATGPRSLVGSGDLSFVRSPTSAQRSPLNTPPSRAVAYRVTTSSRSACSTSSDCGRPEKYR
jgi:hypothetical protein